MKDLALAFSGLARKKLRTALLVFAVFIAFLIYAVLGAFSASLDAATGSSASSNRLVVSNRINFTEVLPIAYVNRVANVPNVTDVSYSMWFGGYYQEERNFLIAFAVEPASYARIFSDLNIPAEQVQRFATQRDCMLAGRTDADRWGWQLGDRVPVSSNIWRQADGSNTWPVEVCAIAEGGEDLPGAGVYINYEYFDEARAFANDTVGNIHIQTAGADVNDQVIEDVDALFQQAVELGRTLPKASASLRVSSLVNLARHFRQFERKPAEAEALYREALDVARRWYPAGHPEIATCLGELAGTVRDQGRLAEAEPLAAETLDMLQGAYGAEHRESIVAKQRLASIVAGRGRSGEAESLYRETLDASRAVFGDGHPLTLSAESELAEMLLARGRHAEAESLLSASLASARRVHGDSDVYAARAWAALGSLHAATGAPSRAEPELRRALEIRRTIHAAGHWRIAEAEAALGGVLARLGRRAEAEALLVSAAAALAKSTAAPPHALERTRQQLAALRRGEPAPAVHQPERRPGGP